MRNLLYILLLFTLVSCKAYKERICSECPVVTKDVIIKKDTTIFKTDTIKIPFAVQGPIQYLENPCKALCDSLGRLKPFEIKKKTNGITGTIKSVGNSIAFDCKTDSLIEIIKTRDRTISILENKQDTKVIQEQCKREHLTKMDSYWIITGRWLFGLLILIILIKLFKTYLQSIPWLAWITKIL